MSLTIYSRAMVVIGASLTLITVLETFLTIQNKRIALTDDLRSRLDEAAQQQAIAVVDTLWTLNRQSAQIILQGVARDPDFLAVTVVDEKGGTFARIGPDDLADQPFEQSTAPVTLDQDGKLRGIGKVVLYFSRERLQQMQRQSLWDALKLGLTQLAAVLLATALALRSVIKPLEAITGRMLNVVRGDLTNRVPHTERADQVGDIARAVEMFRTETSERRRAARELEGAHAELERRVEARTRELRESEQRMQRSVVHAPIPIMIHAADGEILMVSDKWVEISGYARDEMQSVDAWMEKAFGKAVIGASVASVPALYNGEEGATEHTYRLRTKAGASRLWDVRTSPLGTLPGGRRFVISMAVDTTERDDAERRLQQAQKMDAVGRLAGGVAHDFNNLLTVIVGVSELAMDRLSPDDPLRPEVEQILKAGERASALTRQLLAFSRQQVLQPEALDLNRVVESVSTMLRRLIGENIDLVTELAPDLRPVTCDRGQIEQILMNLVVNARDAMPEGGRLTTRTSNADLAEGDIEPHMDIPPGPYVMLAVTDTGSGMDPETIAKIFEPFFTTKGAGKGTGLGLSMVYGIVKQSGGHILVYSEPGHGTTFKLYLPCSKEPLAVGRLDTAVSTPGVSATGTGAETVLLVEDEAEVRGFIRGILQTAGYAVLDTGDVDTAIELCASHGGTLDLLLTDVIMPKMSGPRLAERLAPTRPAMKVLYMSGYTADTIGRHRVLAANVAFLEKPITRAALLNKVRAALGGRKPSRKCA